MTYGKRNCWQIEMRFGVRCPSTLERTNLRQHAVTLPGSKPSVVLRLAEGMGVKLTVECQDDFRAEPLGYQFAFSDIVGLRPAWNTT